MRLIKLVIIILFAFKPFLNFGQGKSSIEISLLYSDYALLENRYSASGAGVGLDLTRKQNTNSINSFYYGFRLQILETSFVPNLGTNFQDLTFEGLSYSQIGINLGHRIDLNWENPKFYFEYDLSQLLTIPNKNKTSSNLELRKLNFLFDLGVGIELNLKNQFLIFTKLFISSNIIRSYNQNTNEIFNEVHKIRQLWTGVSIGTNF